MSDTFQQDKLKDFTIIRNSIFKDYTLSAKAVGVACKLLSLPPTWDYSVKGLVTLFADGEASIRNALKELEDAGYLRREQDREGGKFGKSIYVITDMLKPEKPCVEKPLAVNPSAGNPAQLNTNKSNTKESNTKEYISEFEKLWEIYPRKQGKKKALEHYIKARKEGTTYEEVEEGIYAYTRLIKAEGREEQYIKHGSTFFSQRAWLDDFTVKVKTPQKKTSNNPWADMLQEGRY